MADQQRHQGPHVDPPPGEAQIYAKPQSAGPQVWAVVLAIAGFYYVWTRILGKSLPNLLHFGGGGNRTGTRSGIGGSDNRRAEIAEARERQQQQLEAVARQAKNNGSSTVRERTNTTTTTTTSGNSSSTGLTIQQHHQLFQLQQQRKEKEQEIAKKKKKQRELYLKQKALKEKEEEIRKNDETLGPGWRHRENPDAGNMDPQSGDGGGGGYKAQSCSLKKKRAGG